MPIEQARTVLHDPSCNAGISQPRCDVFADLLTDLS